MSYLFEDYVDEVPDFASPFASPLTESMIVLPDLAPPTSPIKMFLCFAMFCPIRSSGQIQTPVATVINATIDQPGN